MDDLENFASQLVNVVHHPFILNDETAVVSMSVGIAVFPNNGLTVSELIKNADIAMYNAKNSGKNSYRFFDSYMEDDVNRKMILQIFYLMLLIRTKFTYSTSHRSMWKAVRLPAMKR